MWGSAVNEKQPWNITFYGDKGTLQTSVNSYEYTPLYAKSPVHVDPLVEIDKYPGDMDAGKFVSPAIRRR